MNDNVDLFVFKEGRDGRLLRGPRVHFEFYRKSPQYQAFAMFNSLPRSLRDETHAGRFRGRLRRGLLDMAPYEVPNDELLGAI